MVGDDLSILLFCLTLFVAFAVEAVKAETKIRRFAFAGFAAPFLFGGLLWEKLKGIWPPLTEWVTRIATDPVSWFVLFMFIIAAITFARPRRMVAIPDSNDVTGAIESLEREFAFLKGQLDAVPTAIPLDNSDLVSLIGDMQRKALDEIREEVKKIGGLEKNIIRNNQKILGYERDIPAMMEIMMEHLALSTLFNAMPSLPSFTPEIIDLNATSMAVERKDADRYCDEIRNILGNTQWGMDVRSIIASAEGHGEHALRNIPQNQRPDIDTLDLRLYVIAKTRSEMLTWFIQAQRKEAASKYINYLDFIRRRREDRKILDGNQN